MTHQPENRQAEFAAIIHKLKRRRIIIVSLYAVAVVIFAFIAFPTVIYIPGVVEFAREGLPGGISVTVLVLMFIVFMAAYGYTILPIDRALDEECDPEKCLALYAALGSKKIDPHGQAVLFNCFFYMGRYAEAMPYAQQLTQNKKPIYRAAGHFFCAQLGYFMGDAALLREAALRYRADLAAVEKLNAKNRALFDCRTAMIDIMVGLCDGNHQAVAEALPGMKPWSPVPAVTIIIDTLKGIAALPRPDGGGERDEAVYRFMTVKEKGGRTCFVAMAAWYLEQLKGDFAQNLT